MNAPAYAELVTTSNFSFLRGGSHPDELVIRAAELGLTGLGLCDRNSFAGVVRAHIAARDLKEKHPDFRYLVGTRLAFSDGTPDIIAYPTDRAAYGRLCVLLSTGNLRAEKGDCILNLTDLVGSSSNPHPHPSPQGGGERANHQHSGDIARARRLRNEATIPERVLWPILKQFKIEGYHFRRQVPIGPYFADFACHHPRLVIELDGDTHGDDAAKIYDAKRTAFLKRAGYEVLRLTNSDVSRNPDGVWQTISDRLARLPSPLRGGAGGGGQGADNVIGLTSRMKGKMRAADAPAPSLALISESSNHKAVPLEEPREDLTDGQLFILKADESDWQRSEDTLRTLAAAAPGRTWLAAFCTFSGNDRARLARLAELARRVGVPLIATNDVLYHSHERRQLQDVLTCIREHMTIMEAGRRLEKNAERHIKMPAEMARLFAAYPEAIAETQRFVSHIGFSLDQLKYIYPEETVGNGETAQQTLTRLAWEGARKRWGEEIPERVCKGLEHELQLIGEKQYAPYFLTVNDLVRFAREERQILCQGRGSAANSTVCFCLGITAVNPLDIDLLFERFVSTERDEPPDIDIDFEHERREEVMQYLYGKYGRDRAGLTATVVTYRSKGAVREVGKVFGLSTDMIEALNGLSWGWFDSGLEPERVKETGLDPTDPVLAGVLALVSELIGFPRHLSQHVGGFVITRDKLDRLVPIANAAMEDRTTVEWDKDDLDALGILKVDVLALGMLSCIRRSFDLLIQHYGKRLAIADEELRPLDDRVYAMTRRADTIGVFQIESRAQMSMLPRLQPKCFYDLVIEVAIVRPGPIQGDMVHPYLRRRLGLEEVTYPSKELEQVLGKTFGVPLFQEQAMKIAIVAAGFTPGEADKLRRAMATFKRTGTIGTFRKKMIDGMLARGYPQEFAERCFSQIEGFGEYGFPESHAASFAVLVYVSCWLKCYYPDVFCCALLNSQPMGFYAPAQIVRDASEHGVEVLDVDVNLSDLECVLEPGPQAASRVWDRHAEMRGDIRSDKAVRLGMKLVKGLKEADANILIARRGQGYASVRDLWLRTGLSISALEKLAEADAFRSIGLDRRAALWAVRGLAGTAGAETLPLFVTAGRPAPQQEPDPGLPEMPLGEHVIHDYRSLTLSLKQHPMAFLRDKLTRRGVVPAAQFDAIKPGRIITTAGLVLVRQRPGTASGVIFASLEDETGLANIIVWPKTFEQYRRIVLGSRLMAVRGELQREGLVIHIIARQCWDLTHLLLALSDGKDFGDGALARADEGRAGPQSSRDGGRNTRETVAERQARLAMPKGRNFH